MTRVVLPKKTRAQEPTHCKDCGDKLTKMNIRKYDGRVNLVCRLCLNKKALKYNKRRKKALRGYKIW